MTANREGIAVMSRGITLAPCGLIIERVESEAVGLQIVARPASPLLEAHYIASCGMGIWADLLVRLLECNMN